jgi:hypothetical protein
MEGFKVFSKQSIFTGLNYIMKIFHKEIKIKGPKTGPCGAP